MTEAVLDSSAVLALLYREPGHEAVRPYMREGHMSAANLAEAAAKLIEYGETAEDAENDLRKLSMIIHPFGADEAFEAARLREPTRMPGLSLGDRACLALASKLGLPAITTDRHWAKVADTAGVEIVLVR